MNSPTVPARPFHLIGERANRTRVALTLTNDEERQAFRVRLHAQTPDPSRPITRGDPI